jgi:hypothetical protein
MVTKFILHYQNHLTKFAVLRPLTSKLAAEVGFQLLDIFLLFGALPSTVRILAKKWFDD